MTIKELHTSAGPVSPAKNKKKYQANYTKKTWGEQARDNLLIMLCSITMLQWGHHVIFK